MWTPLVMSTQGLPFSQSKLELDGNKWQESKIQTHLSDFETKLYPNQTQLTSQTFPVKNMGGTPLTLTQGSQAFLQAHPQAH